MKPTWTLPLALGLALGAALALAPPALAQENGEPLEAADERTDDGAFEDIQEDPNSPGDAIPWYTFFIAPIAVLLLGVLAWHWMSRGHRAGPRG